MSDVCNAPVLEGRFGAFNEKAALFKRGAETRWGMEIEGRPAKVRIKLPDPPGGGQGGMTGGKAGDWIMWSEKEGFLIVPIAQVGEWARA